MYPTMKITTKSVTGVECSPSTDTSCLRLLRGVVLSLGQNVGGYLTVVLFVNGTRKTQLVHQLVLKTFVGPRPKGYDSCHGDGDKSNNHLSNLRWDTRSENMKDLYRHGRKQSHKSIRSKQIKRSDNVTFDSLRLAAKHMGVSNTAIRKAMARAGKCRGYKWEYV